MFPGESAIHVTEAQQVAGVLKDQYTFIFMSPELLVTAQKHLSTQSLESKQRFKYLFVDESHCVVRW